MNKQQILSDLVSLLSEEELIRLSARAQKAGKEILKDFIVKEMELSQAQSPEAASIRVELGQ